MIYEIIIRPEAERDLSEGFNWYEDKRKGLGHDFLLQVDAGIRFLERTPLAFPEKYKGVRCQLIKRFPYKIFYQVEDSKVVILAVIHAGRDPEWIKKGVKST